MALAASPLPEELTPQHQELSDRLDSDIARVRAEIDSLTKRKNLLVSSLLSSTKIQSQLAPPDGDRNQFVNEQSPLETHAQHNLTNLHRLAYGVTSFPFTDPNPDTSDKPLLGVRFDIPSRNGRFEKAPYYIFFRRVSESDEYSTARSNGEARSNHLTIHHHTIPALVPLQDYEARYLPQPVPNGLSNGVRAGDEGHSSTSADNNGNDIAMEDVSGLGQDALIEGAGSIQDLHALVAAVRHDLLSWQLRNDAISLISEQLGLANNKNGQEGVETNVGKFSVQSIEATAVDARFARLVWQNGAVARLRLTDDGYVDRVVVIGDGGEGGRPDRLKDIERVLTSSKDGNKLMIGGLTERLAVVEIKMLERKRKTEDETNGDIGDQGSMDVDG